MGRQMSVIWQDPVCADHYSGRRVTRGHLSGAGTRQWQRFCTGHRGRGPTSATIHDTSPVPAGTLLPRRSAAAGRGRGQWTLSRKPQPRPARHQHHHTHLVTALPSPCRVGKHGTRPIAPSVPSRACPRTRSSYSDHRPAIRCFQTIPPVLKANLRQFSAIMYYSDYNLEILQRYKVELLWQ